MNELAGLTAVVTGSSSGIGRAIALELGRAGAAVLVHARRSRDSANAVTDELRRLPVNAAVEMSDFADWGGAAQGANDENAAQDAAEAFVDRAWNWRGRVDVWVNNAGADTLTGDAAGWPFAKKLAALWAVDVRATMLLSRAVGRRMQAAGGGAILNMGWDRAERGMAGDSGELFAATKGAVMDFTRSLARSLAPQVRVNCLAPGWIKTAWGEQASDEWQHRAVRETLLARWGAPDDVARVARFLASPAAAAVTGQVVAVCGGH